MYKKNLKKKQKGQKLLENTKKTKKSAPQTSTNNKESTKSEVDGRRITDTV